MSNLVVKRYNGFEGVQCWIDDQYDSDEEEGFHKEDGPAIIYPDGSIEYWYQGECHNPNGPAVISKTSAEHWIHGKRHREDGPAVIRSSGLKMWYINGKLHRLDGPAKQGLIDGSSEWYINGIIHRLDGPALENPNGNNSYYVFGKKVSITEFNTIKSFTSDQLKLLEKILL